MCPAKAASIDLYFELERMRVNWDTAYRLQHFLIFNVVKIDICVVLSATARRVSAVRRKKGSFKISICFNQSLISSAWTKAICSRRARMTS